MTPPQMSGPAPAAVLGRAHANGSCQELRPTHTLGQKQSLTRVSSSALQRTVVLVIAAGSLECAADGEDGM